MFAIALKADRYPTYVLRDGEADARLEVVPERGGLITRWQICDQDILYFDAERFAHPELSVRGGVPVLFPICGNLPDNRYRLDGQTYSLKQHGFARDLPWQTAGQNVTDAAELTLELHSSDVTRQQFPFDFRLRFTYCLQGHTLKLHQQVSNQSAQPMPFALGLHPYFWVRDKAQLRFDLPAEAYRDQNSGAAGHFDGHFDFSQDEIDVAFQPLQGHTATVTDDDLQRQLTLSWSDTYSTLVFWSVQGKDYYCLEPWSAPRNALNSGHSLLMVEPHQTYEAQVTLAVTFF